MELPEPPKNLEGHPVNLIPLPRGGHTVSVEIGRHEGARAHFAAAALHACFGQRAAYDRCSGPHSGRS